MMWTRARLTVLALLAALVAGFFLSGAHHELEFEHIKARQQELEALYAAQPLATVLAFFALYVVIATTSLPGGAVLTMAAGALFGVALGAVLVSFASSIGATFAFLLSRYLLGEWVRARFGRALRRIDEGIERDGALYLFMVRLVPAIPFMLVNVGTGLTRMRPFTYYWVSQTGMLAGTLLFANAGKRLSEMHSPADVLSPQVIAAFLMLALLPLLATRLASRLRRV
jgi:uncharacterized membrane protein YdjX (TVP38/TMEM64 family)